MNYKELLESNNVGPGSLISIYTNHGSHYPGYVIRHTIKRYNGKKVLFCVAKISYKIEENTGYRENRTVIALKLIDPSKGHVVQSRVSENSLVWYSPEKWIKVIKS